MDTKSNPLFYHMQVVQQVSFVLYGVLQLGLKVLQLYSVELISLGCSRILGR